MSRRGAGPRHRAGAGSLGDILFSQGFGSRRECAALLAAGRVALADGAPLTDPAALLGTEGLVLQVDGRGWPVHARALVLLHKPAGFEVSARPGAHRSVFELLPAPLRRRGVQPVGRLDQDTTGLLLFTDDGALLHRLTSPRQHVAKVYEAVLKHPLDAAQLQRLREGVVLHDDPQPVRAAAAEALDARLLRLVLTEGRYHQVKRMVAAAGNRVEALHRSAFGGLVLPPGLPAGQWCWLQADDPRLAAAAPATPTP